jgi:hypothetical protein
MTTSAQAKTIVRHMEFVPRTSTLMGRATRIGVVANYVEFARLGHVTRTRMTQIMNLLNRAPDIQEGYCSSRRSSAARTRSLRGSCGPWHP